MSYKTQREIEEMIDTARNATLRVQDALREIVDSHKSIQSDDDQYDDPELWWSAPTLDHINDAVEALWGSTSAVQN